MTPERQDEVNRRISRRYLTAPADRDLFANEAQFHAEIQRIRKLLTATDEAMAAEGVPEFVRDRVIHRLLHGVPPDAAYLSPQDIQDAHDRMRQRQAAIMGAMSEPVAVPAEWRP